MNDQNSFSVNPSAPVLSVNVNDRIGRLYHRPGVSLPPNLDTETLRALIKEGTLVPSTTNIISVRNSPYLVPWAAKKAAQSAVDMARTNNNFITRVKANPYGAVKYFMSASDRERDHWGEQGSRIHLACELLALGQPIPFDLTEFEKTSIDNWKKWLDDFQPEFKYLEVTGFGETREDHLGFGNTTDFIAKINNKTVIGDYKCVTNDTHILMEDGSVKKAENLQVGDRVVAWDKSGLHVSNVKYVGDNGVHKVAKVTTLSGHVLTTTLNHPYWSSRRNKNLSWVTAENLRPGDEVYIGMGWNYSPKRTSKPWPFNKYLSPYLFGVLWALRNYTNQDWSSQKYTINIPPTSKESLREELHESAFRFNKAGKMSLVKGLQKIASKNQTSVEKILALINTPTLPDFLYAGSQNTYYGFFSGIREVFLNKEISENELVILTNQEAALHLQQLYINYGQPAVVTSVPSSEHVFVKVPFETEETIYSHGATPTRIADIEILDDPQLTVAIEVEGSHTHITGGIITHNTNRSGTHVDVALQLTANASSSVLAVNNEFLTEMPTIDAGIAVHLSPQGAKTDRINMSDDVYDIFQSLRKVWDFHVFEGVLRSGKPVIEETLHSASDL